MCKRKGKQMCRERHTELETKRGRETGARQVREKERWRKKERRR